MVVEFTGERPGRGADFSYDESRHLAAYHHARDLAAGKEVLDAGCGEGFGTQLLASSASYVLGIDYSEEAVRKAREEFALPNLEFKRLDVFDLPSLGRSFDLVCNFQVLEHLREPLPFLRAVSTALKPGGALLLTTPNRLTSVSENPYHVKEYTEEELSSLLKEVFTEVRIYGMMGNEKVHEYDRRRGEQVARILRLDPLGLRHLLPAPVVNWAFGRLAVVVRRRLGGGSGANARFTPADFHPDLDSAKGALDLVALCRR